MILKTGRSKRISWGGNYDDALSNTVTLHYCNSPIEGATWILIAAGVANTVGIKNTYVWTNSGSDITLRYVRISDGDDGNVFAIMSAASGLANNIDSCWVGVGCGV